MFLFFFKVFMPYSTHKNTSAKTHTHTNTKGSLCVAVSANPSFLIWDYGIPIGMATEETMLYFRTGKYAIKTLTPQSVFSNQYMHTCIQLLSFSICHFPFPWFYTCNTCLINLFKNSNLKQILDIIFQFPCSKIILRVW